MFKPMMGRYSKYFLIVVFSSLFFVSCFGSSLDTRGSVQSYRRGLIHTVGGSFRVGELPSVWKQHKVTYRALLFVHEQTKSSISIDSWCKGAFDDGSLASLSNGLHRGLAEHKILSQQEVMIDQRATLKSDVAGSLDGQSVFMRTYVLKKNECVYDFVFLARDKSAVEISDFESLVQGFHVLSSPRIL